MEIEDNLMKLLQIESDLSELKSESKAYAEEIQKLRKHFANESNHTARITEIAQELSSVAQKQRMADIKIDFLEQVKRRFVDIG